MRVHFLYLSLFVFLLGAAAAFAQAAAESVLLNGNSATAAVKAGTVLGQSLNNTNNAIAGKIEAVPRSKVVANKRAVKPQSHLPAPSTASGKRASMITSIRGGRISGVPTSSPHN